MILIDIHSHILPGIDDGSEDLQMSLEMLKIAEKCGTSTIIATPHYCIGYGETPYQQVKTMVSQMNKRAENDNINIKIVHGQEVYFSTNMIEDYKNGIIGTINDSDYLLFELPMHKFDEETFDVIYELQILGLKLILAHPERYKPIINDPSLINKFINEGLLFQLNAGSIEGRFGKEVKKTAETLLENNIYNFCGSDAHNISSRSTDLSGCEKIIKQVNPEMLEVFNESSKNLINNHEIEFIGNKVVKKKSMFSFLRKR